MRSVCACGAILAPDAVPCERSERGEIHRNSLDSGRVLNMHRVVIPQSNVAGLCCCFSSGAETVALGDSTGAVWIANVMDDWFPRFIGTCRAPIVAMAFSPDRKYGKDLAVADQDGHVWLWGGL